MTKFWLVSSVLVLTAVAACGGSDTNGGTATGEDDDAGFSIVTFNAGLARGFVDNAEQRAPVVSDSLADLEVDVIAVQEVWAPEDVAALEAATTEPFPHTSFLDPQPEDHDATGTDTDESAAVEQASPPCPLDESVPLEDCTRRLCADVSDDELADCVLQGCGTEYTATCPECQACLAANLGGSLDEILETCTKAGGGGTYAYGGSFGIGILSSEPFVEQDSLVLDSSLNRRGVLYVQIDDPELGPINIFNTHLSANLDLGDAPVPYPGDAGSWSAEQAAQIEAARQWIDEKTSSDEVTVFLGDMNNSPEGELYSAEASDNYDLLVEGDWVDAYVEDPEARCTYCNSNLLVGVDGGTGPMLDHILVRNFDGEVTVARVLDDPVELVTDEGTVTTNLSDHYGLEAVLTPR